MVNLYTLINIYGIGIPVISCKTQVCLRAEFAKHKDNVQIPTPIKHSFFENTCRLRMVVKTECKGTLYIIHGSHPGYVFNNTFLHMYLWIQFPEMKIRKVGHSFLTEFYFMHLTLRYVWQSGKVYSDMCVFFYDRTCFKQANIGSSAHHTSIMKPLV